MKLDWHNASYGKNEVQSVGIMTTLRYLGTNGRYHVYNMDNGQNIVIFSNQQVLKDYVDENLGSVFLLRFLHPENSKYKYTVEIGEYEELEVLTLARAVVLIPGSIENPRYVYVKGNTNHIE